jgi:MFS family permease
LPKIQNRGVILGLLTVVYAFNFIDRQIIGVLAPFIKADLGLSDTQVGLLTGAVFAIFYTFIGIPIASLVDNTKTIRFGRASLTLDRITIIALSLAVWSFFTLLTGFAAGFMVLALLRIGVAIGEAGCSPPSHSLLSDLYAPKERAKALGTYSLGIPFGTMLAYFAGAFFVSGGTVDWRTAFIVIGFLGLPVAFFLRGLVPEPERGRLDGPSVRKLPFKEALGKLAQIPSYWTMAFGIALASFAGYAVVAFLTTYVTRAFPDVPLVPLLILLGVGNAVFYAGGTYLGGVVADHFGKRSVAAYALVPGVTVAIAGTCLTLGWLAPTFVLMMVAISAFIFFNGFYLGPSFSVAQNLADVSVRATSTAVFFFVLNLVAMGLGPTITGGLSDYFAATTGDPVLGLRYALIGLAVPYALSAGMFLLSSRLLPRDWERARSRDAEAPGSLAGEGAPAKA